MNKDIFAGMVIVTAIVALVILSPFVTIWAINTLFGTTIPFTLKTWAATLALSALVAGSKVTRNKA